MIETGENPIAKLKREIEEIRDLISIIERQHRATLLQEQRLRERRRALVKSEAQAIKRLDQLYEE